MHLVPKNRDRHCSRPQLNRQRDIDNENTVLLNKIMHIMKRKNKSVTRPRFNAQRDVLKHHLMPTNDQDTSVMLINGPDMSGKMMADKALNDYYEGNDTVVNIGDKNVN